MCENVNSFTDSDKELNSTADSAETGLVSQHIKHTSTLNFHHVL